MLASTRAQNGDIERARAEFESMTQPVDREWSARKVAFARVALGDIARHEGNLDEAARQYEGAAVTIDDAPFVAPQFRAMILASMAHLEVDRGDPAAAGLLAEEAVEHALEAKDMPVLARVGVSVAAMWAGLGDEIRAAQVLGACEQLRGAPDLHNADIARLGRRLHGDACAAAYAHGRDLDRKAAIDQVRRR
jgi:ATP/maltotriose-dependent transcriptional regulator MalT